METIDNNILDINQNICNNISKFNISERGLLSQNLLAQLRNFVEYILLKTYSYDIGNNIEVKYKNIKKAEKYVKAKGHLKFLSRFHNLLQISTSHYTLDEENSERLMLKYYEYLIKIKSFLKKEYNLNVLENINEFPKTVDSALQEYYKKIAEKLNKSKLTRTDSTHNKNSYYI